MGGGKSWGGEGGRGKERAEEGLGGTRRGGGGRGVERGGAADGFTACQHQSGFQLTMAAESREESPCVRPHNKQFSALPPAPSTHPTPSPCPALPPSPNPKSERKKKQNLQNPKGDKKKKRDKTKENETPLNGVSLHRVCATGNANE